MASEVLINIPGRLHSIATEGHVTGANEVFDDNRNKTVDAVFGDIDSRINAFSNQNYVSVSSYSGLPVTGALNTIYRVGSWDGTQVDSTKYAEYAWSDGHYVLMDVKSYGVDNVPTSGSSNIVISGGIFDDITRHGEAFDISYYHKEGATLATYASLALALGAIPQDRQHGGMSIKYIDSTLSEYVQYRLTKTTWSTTLSDWSNIDPKVPTSGELDEVLEEIAV